MSWTQCNNKRAIVSHSSFHTQHLIFHNLNVSPGNSRYLFNHFTFFHRIILCVYSSLQWKTTKKKQKYTNERLNFNMYQSWVKLMLNLELLKKFKVIYVQFSAFFVRINSRLNCELMLRFREFFGNNLNITKNKGNYFTFIHSTALRTEQVPLNDSTIIVIFF